MCQTAIAALSGDPAIVDHAIATRQSVRAFLPTPVPRETVEEILQLASRAPSGTNTQPWKAVVLTGAAKERLSDAILAVYNDTEQRKQHTEEYAYYPTKWVDPYLARRRKIGWDLYGLLDIGREDKAQNARTARPQLHVLRCAGRNHFHHRPHPGAGQLARLRHVLAERDGGGACTWARHLPAGSVHAVSPRH